MDLKQMLKKVEIKKNKKKKQKEQKKGEHIDLKVTSCGGLS